MNDITERLEHYAKKAMPHYPNDLCSEAKREIERLRSAPAQCGAGRTEFDAQGEPVRPWMWHFTARDQDALKLKVLDYIDRDNVFGDHFSENERNQIFTLLSAPWEPAEHWRERAEHAESVLEEQDRTSDDQDPPAKWLDGALRDLARELVADPKTPWIGERDPKQHICWTAADRLAARTPAACISEATPNATTVAALQEAEIARLTALVENMRASLSDAHRALVAFKDAVIANDHFRGREYVGLGIQVNDAIDKARLTLSSTVGAPK